MVSLAVFLGAAVPGAGDGDYAWLEALASEPEELVVRGGQYTGPEIVDYWPLFGLMLQILLKTKQHLLGCV